MKIKEITKYELCKLAFKVKNKLLPHALLDTFDTYGKKTHKYPTRNKNLPNIMKHTSTDFNKSFLCKSLWYDHTLSSNIKNSLNLKISQLNIKLNYLINIIDFSSYNFKL